MSVDYVRRLFGLEGQTAVVVGGSGRIGGAICEGLGRAGAALVVAGRSASRGHKRVEVVRALSGAAGFRQVDIRRRDSIEQLLDYTLGEHGQVDILVTAVSTLPQLEEGESDEQLWQRAFDVEVRGPSWATETFAAQMARQKHRGSILLVHGPLTAPEAHLPPDAGPRTGGRDHAATEDTGVSGFVGRADSPLSRAGRSQVDWHQWNRATRAALGSMARGAAERWASGGVRVNMLCIDHFPAPPSPRLSAHALTETIETRSPEFQESSPSATGNPPALGRWGNPEDVVGAALLLVSRRAAAFVTGTVLHVDGGGARTR